MKMEKILSIFKAKLNEVRPITSDMSIVGLRYKNYIIKDFKMQRAETLLKLKNNPNFTLGGLAKHWLKVEGGLVVKNALTLEETLALREHFYQGRLEVFKLLSYRPKDSKLVSLDFNHMYLNIMRGPLPLKRGKSFKARGFVSGALAFYYIKYEMPPTVEPILPCKLDGVTYFVSGLGEGVYWHEEVEYFLGAGGRVLWAECICEFSHEAAILKPFMDVLIKLPDRQIRKGLANQFFGHLGLRS